MNHRNLLWRLMQWAPCFLMLVALSTSAVADTFLYQLTGGGNSVSFTLDTSLLQPEANCFSEAICFEPISVTANSVTDIYSVQFFDPGFGGGFQIAKINPSDPNDVLAVLVDTIGADLFTGTHTNPILSTGSFSLTDFGDGDLVGDNPVLNADGALAGTWALEVTQVPEPASIMLMLSGLGAFSLRKRFSIRGK